MARLPQKPLVINLVQKMLAGGSSDPQIVSMVQSKFGLGWSEKSILKVKNGLVVEPVDLPEIETPKEPTIPVLPSIVPMPSMAEKPAVREEYYRSEFCKTHFYQALLQQFLPLEVEMYLEEYGQICTQFEDIVATEFMQIDDFLKHRILIHRELVTIKSDRVEADGLSAWIHDHASAVDDPNYREKLARLTELRRLLSQSNARYDALVKARKDGYQHLAATRRDRLDDIRRTHQTFFDILDTFHRNRQFRDDQGKYAELTAIAGDDAAAHFRKLTVFPDGSSGEVLLDSECVDETGDRGDQLGDCDP